MGLTAVVIRVQLRIEVVVRSRQSCIQRALGSRFRVVDLLVVVRVSTIAYKRSVTNNEHPVNVWIPATSKIGVERGDYSRIHPDRLRRCGWPRISGTGRCTGQ